jgi:hypothetical protein
MGDQEGNDRSCLSVDLGGGEIAVDFGEALDSSKRKGVVVLEVPQDAIEPIS